MREALKKMDKVLFFLMVVYSILGLVMIFSASSITAVLYNGVEESYFFKKQLIIIAASWFIGLFFLIRFPTHNYKKLAPIGMVGIIGALAFLYPYGSITNSAKSWYDLGFFNVQPSEFAKTVIIVYLAVYYEKLIKKRDFAINKIIAPYIFVIIAVGLVVAQPDLGTGAILAGVAGLILFVLPIKTKQIKMIKLGGVISAIVLGIVVFVAGYSLNAEQSSRLTFRDPCTRYSQKTGYQVCNGFIAINNGGMFGVGLGNSTQKYLYLPEAYTDFIFPVIVEELGAVGGIVIIAGFVFLIFRLIKIARTASTTRGSIIAYGTACFILLHLLVNFMGILALIPLTGVPVPFLSYGGSFYINLIFLLFICLRITIETNNDKTKELIRSL